MNALSDLLNSDTSSVLEASIRFAGQRQRLIAHNIANMTTPDFRPVDVSPRGFQSALARAIQDRRDGRAAPGSTLQLPRTREVQQDEDGSMTLTPRTSSGGVLQHDRNNGDPERMMQDLAENTTVYRSAVELLKSRNDLLKSAIAQRA